MDITITITEAEFKLLRAIIKESAASERLFCGGLTPTKAELVKKFNISQSEYDK